MTGKTEVTAVNDARQKSASGKLEIALALGVDSGRVTVDS